MPTAADRAAWACRFSCTLGRAGIGCASDPVCVPVPTNQRRWSANRSTGSPTVMIGFCCLRRSNSSSSSHLCKLWRTSVSAGQPDDCPVGYLWRTRGITRAVVHRARVTPSPSTVVHRLSTGYPPTFSPGLWIVWCVLARTVPRTFNSLSTSRSCPVDNGTVTHRHPQHHPQGYPQPVGNGTCAGPALSTGRTRGCGQRMGVAATERRLPQGHCRAHPQPHRPTRRPSSGPAG